MAMSANDTSILSKYLADDLVYIHSNGSIDSKASLLKGIASGNLHFISIVAEKRTASIDGNFAWIYGTANLTFKINNSETTIHNYISFIDFFRLNKQQWQEVAWQSAKINRMGNYDNDSVKPQASQSVQPSIY